ncbi:uncharacterized protein LOC134221586 [Armigeres subalbatus]|uniref:uncharacterized protein LOC134221586 n=1 Tax=Armigeres subalbatus TaxID=124917 RepID=UPI002ED061E7
MKSSDLPNLPLVNIEPFVRLLDEADAKNAEDALTAKASNTGTIPKIFPKLIGNTLPFTMWHRETTKLRNKHIRQQHPKEEQEKRKREEELMIQLKRSEDQREQDRQRMQEIEVVLKRQQDVEERHQKEDDVRRKRELDLVNRLKVFKYAEEQQSTNEQHKHCPQSTPQGLAVSSLQPAAPENLLRLQRSLKGAAKDAVNSFLLHPFTVPQVLSTLQTLYGRPEQIVHNLETKARGTPAPKAERLETIIQFGLTVQNLCGHLEAVGSHLSNPILLQELVDKLPANIKFNWALYQESLPVVDLKTFSEYMRKVTTATSGVTNFCITGRPTKDEKSKTKDKAFVNAHATHEGKDLEQKESGRTINSGGRREVAKNDKAKRGGSTKNCPLCNVYDHTAASCASFKKLSIDGRWNVVKDNKLCRRCLVSHNRWPCEGEVCGINDCEKRHHRLLHYEAPKKQPAISTEATVTIHRQPISSTLFKILPVTLHGKNGAVNTYAFLDDGSCATLVEQTIANELGVTGTAHSLCIHWPSGINKKIETTQIDTLSISELGSDKRFSLSEVYTVKNLGLPQQSLDFNQLTKEFEHLRHLPVKSFEKAVPGLLIGLSNSHLLTTTKLREGNEREPIATKTRIGWVVCGRVQGGEQQLQHRQMHICADTIDHDLHDYEFPDSRSMAERRLKCLERRLEKDPQLYESVRQQMADFETKGYVHVVTKQEMETFDPARTWYLPLGVVQNPNKSGKVRVIWDAAAKVGGVSLNTMLLKGPELLTPQLSVTFKTGSRVFWRRTRNVPASQNQKGRSKRSTIRLPQVSYTYATGYPTDHQS